METHDDRGATHIARPTFSGRIDLGHILQSAVLIIMVGTGMGTMYASVQGQLSTQAEVNASQNQQLVDLSRRVTQLQEDQRQSSRDIATTLNKMTETLGELRVRIAESLQNVRK